MLKELMHALDLASESTRSMQKALEEVDWKIRQLREKAAVQQELAEQFAGQSAGEYHPPDHRITSETARLAREQTARTQATLRKLKDLQTRQGYFQDLLAICESTEARAREALESARRGLASKKGGIEDR